MQPHSKSDTPPTADIAEQCVIATIFENPEWLPRLRSAGVTAEGFFTHRRHFEEMADFIDDNGTIELNAFMQHLETTGAIDAVGGRGCVEVYHYPTFGAYGWPKWIEQIQEAYALRLARNLHLSDADYDDSDEAVEAIKKTLDAIALAKSGPQRAANAKTATEAFLARFAAMRENGELPGKSTGIHEIDAVSGGMRPGELWVVCGQTSRGKSVLMLQMAAEVLTNGGKVAIFSLEMSKEEVVGRLVTVTGRIDYGQITTPQTVVTKHEVAKIRHHVTEVAKMQFWIDDRADQTISHIIAESQILSETEGPLDLVVVDYVQLVDGERNKSETREQEISRVSKGLKQLAKRLGCPVISASQLTDDNKVRESRAIGHDADNLLFIGDDGILTGKLRNGKRNDVLPLQLEGRLQRFVRVNPKAA